MMTILFFLCLQNPSAAENLDLEKNPDIPWNISADEVLYDNKNLIYKAKGNVIIEKMDREIRADRVQFDQKSMHAIAEGNVVMSAGDDIIRGEKIELDLKTETGTIHNGSIFISQNHFYIGGKTIEKTGKDSYIGKKTYITSCDGDSPDWKITARSLNVTIEGYGYATNAAFWVKKAPFFYTPILVFPVKTKRQSGLLAPEIEIMPKRKGTTYLQPFFWAINDSMDATFYYHLIEKRGHKGGVEVRYVIDNQSKAIIMADGLTDDHIDDGTAENAKWGYSHDLLSRPNSDRYWVRAKKDLELPFEIGAKLDIDIVSDQDYLKEFKGGMTGFKANEEIFIKKFGRDLDDRDDVIRKNQLLLTKNVRNLNFTSGIIFYDDVTKRRFEENDPTLQKLPFIQIDASKGKAWNTPFYYSLNSESTRFYRRDGRNENDITSAYRGDLHPRVYLPMKFKNYLSFQPSIGYRKTAWYIDTTESQKKEEEYAPDNVMERDIHDVRMELSTSFYRIFNAGLGNVDRVKHHIQPQIVYDFIPEKNQSMYPSFDSIDRIERKDLVTYSLTQIFTSRAFPLKRAKGKDSTDEETSPVYNQFLRLKLEQSFDLNEYRLTESEDKRPYQDLKGELDLAPLNFFQFDGDASWNVYDGEFVTADIGLLIWDLYGNRLKSEYRYKQDSTSMAKDGSESIYTEALFSLSDKLSLMGHIEQSLYDDETLETGLGFRFMEKCWLFELEYLNEEEESRYRFMIVLNGLGKIGE